MTFSCRFVQNERQNSVMTFACLHDAAAVFPLSLVNIPNESVQTSPVLAHCWSDDCRHTCCGPDHRSSLPRTREFRNSRVSVSSSGGDSVVGRSEERRVGKEGRYTWSADHQ